MTDYLKKLNDSLKSKGYLHRHSLLFSKHISRQDVIDWCNELYIEGEDYQYSGFYFWFKNEKHYTWFILKWA